MFVDIQAHWHVLLNPIPKTHTHYHLLSTAYKDL